MVMPAPLVHHFHQGDTRERGIVYIASIARLRPGTVRYLNAVGSLCRYRRRFDYPTRPIHISTRKPF